MRFRPQFYLWQLLAVVTAACIVSTFPMFFGLALIVVVSSILLVFANLLLAAALIAVIVLPLEAASRLFHAVFKRPSH